jgi:hypothetical protein
MPNFAICMCKSLLSYVVDILRVSEQYVPKLLFRLLFCSERDELEISHIFLALTFIPWLNCLGYAGFTIQLHYF